jgi:hypothetical protein
MCPLATNMTMIVHPFAHFGPALPLIAALPMWLHPYILYVNLKIRMILITGVITNIIFLTISIYNCFNNTLNPVLSVNYTPPEEEVEQLT